MRHTRQSGRSAGDDTRAVPTRRTRCATAADHPQCPPFGDTHRRDLSPHLGFGLPVSGSWATPGTIAAVARRAEDLGVRLAVELPARARPREEDYGAQYRAVLDPIVALGFAAAVTEQSGWASRCSTPRSCRRRSWPSSSRRWTCCPRPARRRARARLGAARVRRRRRDLRPARAPAAEYVAACARSGPTTRWSSRRVLRRPTGADAAQARAAAGATDPARRRRPTSRCAASAGSPTAGSAPAGTTCAEISERSARSTPPPGGRAATRRRCARWCAGSSSSATRSATTRTVGS